MLSHWVHLGIIDANLLSLFQAAAPARRVAASAANKPTPLRVFVLRSGQTVCTRSKGDILGMGGNEKAVDIMRNDHLLVTLLSYHTFIGDDHN
jgi:hypothetical protein